MKIVDKISVKELQKLAKKMDGNLVKADVDLEKKLVIIDMPMHFEGEQYLLENGSKQSDSWGINLMPAKYGTDDFIVFESMINIKAHNNNPSMTIKSAEVREQKKVIIDEVIYG